MSYADLLRDPRWQRKRLEVMHRADFACEVCRDKTTTLNVHHVQYVRGRMPWEYEASELRCLCEPCHAKEHGIPEPVVPAPSPRTYHSDEEREVYERLSEIDRQMPSANNEQKDALLSEKCDLAGRLRELRPARWTGRTA